jgi:dipeptidyl aminopeptidase/acylaminoacyl peptidase
MPDIREVYEMVTKQKAPEHGALERQQKRQVRTARNRKLGGFAVAAAFGVAAVVAVILGTRAGQNETTPAEEPATVAPGTGSGPFLLDLDIEPPRPQGQSWAGERRPLAESLAGGFAYVASPDGTRVVYGTGQDGGCSGEEVVTVANIDGTDVDMLQSPEGLNICGARWSPDGTKLVYQERNGADPDSVGNLFVQDVDTGRRTQITDLELTEAWWWFLSPSFSPDGRNVVFHMPRDSSETTTWDVWSVPATGGESTLELRNASFPMLSPLQGPEGLGIQFVSPMADDFAGHSIMTARPIPSSDIRSTLVEANDSIWWPTLSPGGRWMAYQDGGSIYVVDVANLDGGPVGEFSKVAEGETAEWLDNDTLIVAP